MRDVKGVLRSIKNLESIKLVKAHIMCPILKSKRYKNRKLNFYFLSTGRCGTRFFSQVLRTATNAYVRHQPGPQLRKVGWNIVSIYVQNKDKFKALTVDDYPLLKEKLFRQLTVPFEIYGDTLNHMYPFGYMLYKYLGPKRLRLVHLIRNPVDCGQSILKSERDDTGHGRFHKLRAPKFITGENPAEKTANVWNNINRMIQYQFELIDNPSVCKTFRLEDVSVESIQELFDFLDLEGFDMEKVSVLMEDTSHNVRHSHIDRNPERMNATEEELTTISRMCAPLASEFGYNMSFLIHRIQSITKTSKA